MSLNEQICIWILNHKMLTGALVMALLLLSIILLVDAIEDYKETKKEAENLKNQKIVITQENPTIAEVKIAPDQTPDQMTIQTENLQKVDPVKMDPVVMNQIRKAAMQKMDPEKMGNPTLKLKRNPA